jgi:1,3-beta-galactosyl-N-acetylhexosamine phosphorylase
MIAAKLTGLVTLPAEAGKEQEVLELVEKWGADAIRDSDGTRLSPALAGIDRRVYSTICLVRADQQWAYAHRDQLAQKYLMSERVTATGDTVEIDLLRGYFKPKYEIDAEHDPAAWWEVIDRTTGQVVEPSGWRFDREVGTVTVHPAVPFHVYTVNFLVYQTWDSTSMYNHLTNGWTTPPVMSVDPYLPDAYAHLMDYFDRWLAQHAETDIVRLTTLAYHFTLDSDETGKDKYRDWLGYSDAVSPRILDDFAREMGYRLRSEDFTDEGYYNATYRLPSPQYRDWMDFVHRFVVRYGKDLVDRVHRAGKQAAIFWGDHWIGVEPYSPHFQEMGIDINIGACEDGVALRRLADSPGPQVKEIRLYPYFFPDVFGPNGNPLAESQRNWAKIRRAMYRRGVDRIGYGGYLSVTLQFPEFVDHVAELCDEFRTLVDRTQHTAPYTAPVKVGVLNAWGKLRSWINNVGPAEKFHNGRPDVTELVGSNFLECLAGLPVEVEFLSFSDIEAHGIPEDIDVIINNGPANTAWSGGYYWKNERVATALRGWVHRGGGFIGIEDPSACEFQGRFFQLSDVLGVEKERGCSTLAAAPVFSPCASHFITHDLAQPVDLGVEESYVYVDDPSTDVVAANPQGHVLIAAHEFGSGRAVYLAGLPYSHDNSRLLYRSLLWSSRQEQQLERWFSANPNTDCAAFPQSGWAVVANASASEQTTTLYDGEGRPVRQIVLAPYAAAWVDLPVPPQES